MIDDTNLPVSRRVLLARLEYHRSEVRMIHGNQMAFHQQEQSHPWEYSRH